MARAIRDNAAVRKSAPKKLLAQNLPFKHGHRLKSRRNARPVWELGKLDSQRSEDISIIVWIDSVEQNGRFRLIPNLSAAKVRPNNPYVIPSLAMKS